MLSSPTSAFKQDTLKIIFFFRIDAAGIEHDNIASLDCDLVAPGPCI